MTQREQAQTQLEKVLKDTKKAFVYVGLFSLFINLLMLVPSLYMLQVYDRVLASQSIETLVLLTIIVAVLFITKGILEMVRSRILVRIGNKIDLDLNAHLFDVIFLQARLAPGKASTQPLTDLTKIRQFMTGQGVFAFFDAPWFPIYLFVMYLFSPWLLLFAVVSSILILTITVLNDKTTKKGLMEANKANTQALSYINKNLNNAEIVQAMGMNENIKKIWLKKHYAFLHAQSTASDVAGKWKNISTTLRQFLQSLTYGVGALLAIFTLISPGMIIAGAVLLGRALAPLDLLTNSWKSFADARESYKRLNTLLQKIPEIPEPMQLPEPEGHLTLEQVVVTAPGAKTPIVKGISMDIPAGSVVGIIGPSASGKSTLARAILGVWPLQNGKVRLDGADIHQWNNVELGPHIGYLPQDIELFEGSISQNISRFGDLDPTEVVAAAKIAGVHEMILKLPQGYDTVVGPGGATLSGGQRQRVGLARALYKKPKIIVLDEPNSNLDDEGDRALAQAIITMKQNRSTILIITHKKSILQAVDKLAVLANGQLSLYGPKEAVVAKLNEQAQAQAQAQQQHAAKAQQATQQNAAAKQAAQQSAVPKMTTPGA